MTDNLTREYLKLRTKNERLPASIALRWARANVKPSLWEWDWREETATRELDGFTLTLTMKPDEDIDISWFGSFDDRWNDDALSNRDSDTRHAYKWFHPATTADEHRRGLRQVGYGRHEAWTLGRAYVRRDLETAREYSARGVIVTASREGIELGSASLWGIDGDDSRYFESCADDLASEVINEAREALERLAVNV